MARLDVQPDDSIWDRLKEKGELLEATYVDPSVSQYVRDEGRRLKQYYSAPPTETEESKKYGSIRAPRAADKPAETLSDILGFLPQGALAKMGGLATAKGMMFAGSANDVYKDLKRYQKFSEEAIPSRFYNRSLPDYHHLNHDAAPIWGVSERVNADIKDVADTLLEMYYGEKGRHGYAKVPQLNPDKAFKGVDELSIFPLVESSGKAMANTTKTGSSAYYALLNDYYIKNKLTPHGNVPDYTSGIILDSTTHGSPTLSSSVPITPIDEAVRRLRLSTVAEHESAHVRQIKGHLTDKEIEVQKFLQQQTYNHQTKMDIHNALIKEPEVSTFQHWDSIKPGAANYDWAGRPDEQLATVLGIGNASPNTILSPSTVEEFDTPITRFLRYGNFDK